MGKIIRNGIEYGGTYDSATSVNYDNSVSGLNARTVQEGIDELNESLVASDNLKFQFATDGEGNYGFLGADDSFIPFKKKNSQIYIESGNFTCYSGEQFRINIDCTSGNNHIICKFVYNISAQDVIIRIRDANRNLLYKETQNVQGGTYEIFLDKDIYVTNSDYLYITVEQLGYISNAQAYTITAVNLC